MRPEFIVGEVGLGSNFCGEDANLRLRITDLEGEVSKLKKDKNVLRRALRRCAALTREASDDKHHAMLVTAS